MPIESMHQLTFHGAAETVTGSKYLLESGGSRVLIDCGLFQGIKELRLRNWEPLSFDAASVDSVVLTHAHVDHIGYLPRFVKSGFRGPVYCTRATAELAPVILVAAAITILGYGTLVTSSYPPLRSIGIVSVVSVVVLAVASVLVLPALLLTP